MDSIPFVGTNRLPVAPVTLQSISTITGFTRCPETQDLCQIINATTSHDGPSQKLMDMPGQTSLHLVTRSLYHQYQIATKKQK